MNAIQIAAKIAEYQKEITLALEKIAYYTRMADSAMKARELAYWTKKLNDARAALQLLQAGAGAGAAGSAGGGTGAGGNVARHVIPRVFGGIGRVVSFGGAQGGAAVAVGVGTVVVAGIAIWVAAGIAGGMWADKPVQAGQRQPQSQPPEALQGPVAGEALPTNNSNSGGSLGGALGPIPETVDRDSFTGVWVKGAGTTAVSRAVLVQSGSDVKGRVEIPEGIYGENGKILIARGTYDLTGTVADRKLTFTMDKFTGDVSLNPTGARGMFLSGFMNAPGGRYLGTPFALQREVPQPKKK